MIDAKWAEEFAQEWIDAWNAHDLTRILSHYTDDFEMRSPIIVERMGVVSGLLEGKKAVSSYWEPALVASSSLKFVLHDVLVGDCDADQVSDAPLRTIALVPKELDPSRKRSLASRPRTSHHRSGGRC